MLWGPWKIVMVLTTFMLLTLVNRQHLKQLSTYVIKLGYLKLVFYWHLSQQPLPTKVPTDRATVTRKHVRKCRLQRKLALSTNLPSGGAIKRTSVGLNKRAERRRRRCKVVQDQPYKPATQNPFEDGKPFSKLERLIKHCKVATQPPKVVEPPSKPEHIQPLSSWRNPRSSLYQQPKASLLHPFLYAHHALYQPWQDLISCQPHSKPLRQLVL
jgi:hypothetical protein